MRRKYTTEIAIVTTNKFVQTPDLQTHLTARRPHSSDRTGTLTALTFYLVTGLFCLSYREGRQSNLKCVSAGYAPELASKRKK